MLRLTDPMKEVLFSRSRWIYQLLAWFKERIGLFCNAQFRCRICYDLGSVFGTRLIDSDGVQRDRNQFRRLPRHSAAYLKQFRSAKQNFLHDNATVHRPQSTKDWFAAFKGLILNWPSLFPNLNLIENLLAIVVQGIYNCRHFTNIEELKKAIKDNRTFLTEIIRNVRKNYNDTLFTYVYIEHETIRTINKWRHKI